MGQTLRKNLKNKILLLLLLLPGVIFEGAYGQSTGDIAVIGFNSDGDDDFALTTFTDIPSGTTIYFTDRSWDGANEEFTGSEGAYTYTVPSGGFNAGDVIAINPDNETASDGGLISHASGNFNLTNGGDELYFYLSSGGETPEDNPATFLFAITNDNAWDANELDNTGLSDGTTALSDIGGSINDNGEYIGTREGTISTLKSEIRKNESNWKTTDESGDQSITFKTTSFSIVNPPTIAFATSAVDSSEGSGTAELTIELVEANGTAVDVDVAFLDNPSTASLSDIDNYSTQTVSFGSDASNGDTETVSVEINDDSEFEGTEKAIFQLQNNTEGSIIEPEVITLTVEDNDAPDVVINEIHADPAAGIDGDADGNGTRDQGDDEFVEFINNQDADIDITGWKFFNEDDHKHTFPEGTVIPANGALVLFGDDGVSPQGNFGGAIIQSSNESASLSLVNGGDIISLEDENGNQVASVNYPDAGNDQSIVRDPEITGSFNDHSDVAADSENLFSPGTKVDGSPFGSKHAIGIRGSEGWRMISSPVQDATFEDFFGDFRMQGITGSDDPSGDGTLFSWNETGGGSFTAPGNMDNNLTPGKGYIVYVFEDDDPNSPGIQGGFPKIVNTDKDENSGTVEVSVSATDDDESGDINGKEGWNLLGNPFDTEISASAVLDALENVDPAVSTNISVWDYESASWVVLDGQDTSDDTIAPFQAFFVRFTSEFSSTQVSFNKSDLEVIKGAEFYKNPVNNSYEFALQLHGQEYYDTYSMEFNENGSTDLDRFDAYKLFSLNPDAISLFSTINDNRLQKKVLPRELESNLKIPLSFDANGRTSLTFRWDDRMGNIPSEWDLILIDNEQNRQIDLQRNKKYSFDIVNPEEQQASKSFSDQKGLLNKSANTQDSRFVLSVQPNVQESSPGDLPETVTLKPNYPNPFNPTTTIPYELDEDSDVLLTVWNMIGQKVATLVDGTVEAGTHEVTWSASDMPSGIYIARFEVNGTVFTRKMTLIK